VHWQSTPYTLPLLIVASISAALALYAWDRRPAPGTIPLVWLMLAAGGWSLTYLLELGSVGLPVKLFWARVQYFGILIMPVAWLAAVFQYIDREAWLKRRKLVLLVLVPVATLLQVWTNDTHNLIWSDVQLARCGSLSVLELSHGVGFWIHTGYSYLLLFLGAITLFRKFVYSSDLYRGQAAVMLLGALMPWIGNVSYLAGVYPIPCLDLTPFSFTFTGLAVAWGLLRFRLLDIVPVMRDAVIESMGDGAIVLDVQDRVLDLNPAAQRIIGRTTGEAIGQPVCQVLSDWLDVLDACDSVKKSRVEVVLDRRAGHVYYDLRISPLYDRRQRLSGRLVMLHDITERKQAESQRDATLEALRQRNRVLALLNQVGQELAATLELQQISERLLQEVTETIDAEGASVWLWDEEQPAWLTCRAAFQRNRGHAPINIRLRAGQGVAGWVAQTGNSVIVPYTPEDARFFSGIDEQTGLRTISLLAAPLLVRGTTVGALEVVNKLKGDFDGNDLRLVETLAASAAIAIENARLVEALRKYALELEVRNEDLDAFAHTAAHDLKGPLAKVVGYCEVLKDAYSTISDEEIERYLRMIAQQGRRMSNIIEEMLLLAGVRKGGGVVMRPLDMARIVAEAQSRLAYLIEEHRAEIILPERWPVAMGYAPWVEEVWINYLSNAIKYGGQPPRVDLGATVEADGEIRFWVRDNGLGLTPGDQVKLFTPFTRLDEVRAKGHGLGLSIVRRIVERLGGEVGVDSQVGVGSVFSFSLQRA
jgi:PAS domain S-box-containing protein